MKMEPPAKGYFGYRPNVGIRLLVWAGIYLVGALPVALLLGTPMGLVIFPWGLVLALSAVMPKWWTDNLDSMGIGFAYGFYIVHLILSLVIPSARVFRILMIILIVAVVVNLATCVVMLDAVKSNPSNGL